MTEHKRAKLKGKREEKRKWIAARQRKRRDEASKQARMELAAARAIDEMDLAHLGFFADIAGRVFKHLIESQAREHLRDASLDHLGVTESQSIQ